MWSKLRHFIRLIRSFVFTLILHGALIVLLLYSFNWVEQTERGGHDPIQAVAISEKTLQERVRKKQAAIEQKRLVAEKKRKAAEAKKLTEEKKRKAAEKKAAEKKAAEEKATEERERLEAETERREEELREQLEQEQGDAKKDADEAFRAMIERIASAVENNWRRPHNSQGGLTAIIRVKVDRDGRVIFARVTKSSGDQFFDRSAEIAVQQASPLPFPTNPEYYEFISEFNLKFDPDEF